MSAAKTANAFIRSGRLGETALVPITRERRPVAVAEEAAEEGEMPRARRDTTSTNILLRRSTGRPAYIDEQGRAWA